MDENFIPTPDFEGCGCKICRAGLGEQINWLASRGREIEELQDYLKANGLEVSKKYVKKHLEAFGLKPGNPDLNTPSGEEVELVPEPITEYEIINSIDFSQYNFDEHSPESVIGFLQKLALKIHLGTSAIAMRDIAYAQATGGQVDTDSINNYIKTQSALSKITAIEMVVNQQKAIRTVEGLGLKIENFNSLLPPTIVTNQTEAIVNEGIEEEDID